MSTSVDQAFIKQYEADVHIAYQRMGSKLRNTVRQKNNITGESTTAEAFALAVERAAPGVTITAAGPLLPIAPGMDGASLRRDFPTVPLTTVADGVARTIAFYREEK